MVTKRGRETAWMPSHWRETLNNPDYQTVVGVTKHPDDAEKWVEVEICDAADAARLTTATELLRSLRDEAAQLVKRVPCSCTAPHPCDRCQLVAAVDVTGRFLEGDSDDDS